MTQQSGMMQHSDVCIVIPVYNEEQTIASILRAWSELLEEMAITYKLIVINDGSTDGTAASLSEFDGSENIFVHTKANAGHGPAVLDGYTQAVPLANFIFQCDSDDEIAVEEFSKLWERREEFDAVFGLRTQRQQSTTRQLISLGSRVLVQVLCGSAVKDVNVPFRLMKKSFLQEALQFVRSESLVPNIIISAYANHAKASVLNIEVIHNQRKFGKSTLSDFRAVRFAIKSAVELFLSFLSFSRSTSLVSSS